MELNKTKELIAIIIGTVIVVLVILGFVFGWFSGISGGNVGTGGTGSLTKSAVPAGTVVPGVGATSTPKNVAVPQVVTPAAPGVSAQLRVFNISADKDAFAPSTVIANEGDTVHINFTAVDKTYDITFPDYGMKQTAAAGETKILEFQATSPGKFAYYCESCGNSATSPSGYIIIVSPSASH
jgi:plastocyanin